jgi:glucose-1-phosphate thymidylyltransferase
VLIALSRAKGIMKSLVLAGGTGTRLRPLSHSMPKQLLPVANRPVLFRCLDDVRRAGITDVGIVIDASDVQIRTAVGDGSQFGLRVQYIRQDSPRGLAHAVMVARDFLGTDDFLMYLADNVLTEGIADLADRFREDRPDAQLLVTKVADPTAYGILELDDEGRLLGVVEKPLHPRSDLALTGVYFFTPGIHEAVRRIAPSSRDELEITDAIQWLIEHGGRVQVEIFSGYWKDAGRIEDLLECNRALLAEIEPACDGLVDDQSEFIGPVVVGPRTRICRSRIVGPVVIGADTLVEGSYVGPCTALGSDCVLVDTGIENSIILDRASICGVRGLQGSVIGRSAEVRSAPNGKCELAVGDHSQIRLAR